MHEERHWRCMAPSGDCAEAIRYGVTALPALLALALLMPQAMAQGCPLVAKPPVLAHETAPQAIDGTFDPDEEINSI